MADPAIAMRGRFVPACHDRMGDLGGTLGRTAAYVEGRRKGVTVEEVEYAPNAGPRSIFVDVLHGEIAHAVRQDRGKFAGLVVGRLPILLSILRPFLEIDDEGNGEIGVVRPNHLWLICTIADEITPAEVLPLVHQCTFRLDHHVAAIGRHCLSHEIASVARGEQHRSGSNLFGLPEPAERKLGPFPCCPAAQERGGSKPDLPAMDPSLGLWRNAGGSTRNCRHTFALFKFKISLIRRARGPRRSR
jgi:hypothetical protein